MPFNRRQLVPLVLLGLWLGAAYWLRFYLMENLHWVDICGPNSPEPQCAIRSNLGLAIHFRVLASVAVVAALLAFFLKGKAGRVLAWVSLIFTLPALALYTVTMAVFALLLAGMRLVRDERSVSVG
jgi:hypothetical protein